MFVNGVLMKKKLSVAFLWHMHQPVYQDSPDGTFFMPWVRLHAVKDYLDMLFIMDKFPTLKLNFNLSPTILNAFKKYADGYDDIHSVLSAKPVEELSDEDKLFILNYFFDANYNSMIMHHTGYDILYKKRNALTEVNVDDFSLQEYSDIMFWFNVAWMDPLWRDYYPEINTLLKKNKDFTLEDRLLLLNIQRDIIKKIIPAYKKYQDDGKIEISTNPLYHPILPLLSNVDVAKNSTIKFGLPNCKIDMKEDARAQIRASINLYENLFGKKPKGMWPPELSISEDILGLFNEEGISWTIADESILSESLKREFTRDVRGNLEDPYHLSHVYTYNTNENSDIGLFFRNSDFANLIGFEYPHYDSIDAANDLYDRIKQIQDKLSTSPDKNHIVVIAMDGENSWENYSDDGHKFLETLYSLISNDDTLLTETLSTYFERVLKNQKLNNVVPGSWINKNFQLWIDEPTKNKAWEYLVKVRDDLLEMEKDIEDEALISSLWREIFVAEGSDWFWWFGEPNDSGQDNLFDYLYRRHLQNVYLMLNKPVPDFLQEPLIFFANRPSRVQKSVINPYINGFGDSLEWNNAGCIDIPSGPLSDANQILNKICFGIGDDNLFFKIDLNHYAFDKFTSEGNFYQIYIYIKNRSYMKSAKGRIRLVMRPETIYPILSDTFSHEIKLTFTGNKLFPVEIAYSDKDSMWFSTLSNNVKYQLANVLEIQIPFEDINFGINDIIDFVIIDGSLGKGSGVYPRDMFLTAERKSFQKISSC